MSAPLAPATAQSAVGAASSQARPPSTVRCFAMLVAVKASLLVLGFGRTHRLATRLSRDRDSAAAGLGPVVNATAERVAMAAAFFPGRALCLEQSLALYVVLRRMGIQAALRFGVQAYPFAAHAWVEHGGEAVNEIPERLKSLVQVVPFAEQTR